jgi:hypothetical protein
MSTKLVAWLSLGYCVKSETTTQLQQKKYLTQEDYIKYERFGASDLRYRWQMGIL